MKKSVCLIILLCFLVTGIAGPRSTFASDIPQLPLPGTMMSLSQAYMPVMIKGLKVHPENPLLFDFVVDTGNSGLSVGAGLAPAQKGRPQGSPLQDESNKLIKYFLASLTIPEKDLWVNLSPYEKDRIVPEELGNTELGRDMLAQDYILKQLTASLIYPEKDLGKKFWDKVYAKAQALYGNTQIPVNTFNKVWIVADKAKVLERNNVGYIVGAHLKVMLEEDYLANEKNQTPTRGHVHYKTNKNVSPSMLPSETALNAKAPQGNTPNALANQIIRDIILPELENEVNQGQNFAPLRQMFYSMILATWYKQTLKNALLNQVYSNKAKIEGVKNDDPIIKEKIYQQYLSAYKKGVFNYIKEDLDSTPGQRIPRKYFSGGMIMGIEKVLDRTQTETPHELTSLKTGDMAMVQVLINKSSDSSKTPEPVLAENPIIKKLLDLQEQGKKWELISNPQYDGWIVYKAGSFFIHVPSKEGALEYSQQQVIENADFVLANAGNTFVPTTKINLKQMSFQTQVGEYIKPGIVYIQNGVEPLFSLKGQKIGQRIINRGLLFRLAKQERWKKIAQILQSAMTTTQHMWSRGIFVEDTTVLVNMGIPKGDSNAIYFDLGNFSSKVPPDKVLLKVLQDLRAEIRATVKLLDLPLSSKEVVLSNLKKQFSISNFRNTWQSKMHERSRVADAAMNTWPEYLYAEERAREIAQGVKQLTPNEMSSLYQIIVSLRMLPEELISQTFEEGKRVVFLGIPTAKGETYLARLFKALKNEKFKPTHLALPFAERDRDKLNRFIEGQISASEWGINLNGVHEKDLESLRVLLHGIKDDVKFVLYADEGSHSGELKADQEAKNILNVINLDKSARLLVVGNYDRVAKENVGGSQLSIRRIVSQNMGSDHISSIVTSHGEDMESYSLIGINNFFDIFERHSIPISFAFPIAKTPLEGLSFDQDYPQSTYGLFDGFIYFKDSDEDGEGFFDKKPDEPILADHPTGSGDRRRATVAATSPAMTSKPNIAITVPGNDTVLTQEFYEGLDDAVTQMEEFIKLQQPAQIICLGGSPEWIFRALEVKTQFQNPNQYADLRRKIKYVAFSRPEGGVFYYSQKEVDAYRTYLKKLGITPRKIINRDKPTIIVDKSESGESLRVFIRILEKWAEDVNISSSELGLKLGLRILSDHRLISKNGVIRLFNPWNDIPEIYLTTLDSGGLASVQIIARPINNTIDRSETNDLGRFVPRYSRDQWVSSRPIPLAKDIDNAKRTIEKIVTYYQDKLSSAPVANNSDPRKEEGPISENLRLLAINRLLPAAITDFDERLKIIKYIIATFKDQWEEAISLLGHHLMDSKEWEMIDRALRHGLPLVTIAEWAHYSLNDGKITFRSFPIEFQNKIFEESKSSRGITRLELQDLWMIYSCLMKVVKAKEQEGQIEQKAAEDFYARMPVFKSVPEFEAYASADYRARYERAAKDLLAEQGLKQITFHSLVLMIKGLSFNRHMPRGNYLSVVIHDNNGFKPVQLNDFLWEGPIAIDQVGFFTKDLGKGIEGKKESLSIEVTGGDLKKVLKGHLFDDEEIRPLLGSIEFQRDPRDLSKAKIYWIQAWLRQSDRLTPEVRAKLGSIEEMVLKAFHAYAKQNGIKTIQYRTGSRFFRDVPLVARQTVNRVNKLFQNNGYRLVFDEKKKEWFWQIEINAAMITTSTAKKTVSTISDQEFFDRALKILDQGIDKSRKLVTKITDDYQSTKQSPTRRLEQLTLSLSLLRHNLANYEFFDVFGSILMKELYARKKSDGFEYSIDQIHTPIDANGRHEAALSNLFDLKEKMSEKGAVINIDHFRQQLNLIFQSYFMTLLAELSLRALDGDVSYNLNQLQRVLNKIQEGSGSVFIKDARTLWTIATSPVVVEERASQAYEIFSRRIYSDKVSRNDRIAHAIINVKANGIHLFQVIGRLSLASADKEKAQSQIDFNSVDFQLLVKGLAVLMPRYEEILKLEERGPLLEDIRKEKEDIVEALIFALGGLRFFWEFGGNLELILNSLPANLKQLKETLSYFGRLADPLMKDIKNLDLSKSIYSPIQHTNILPHRTLNALFTSAFNQVGTEKPLRLFSYEELMRSSSGLEGQEKLNLYELFRRNDGKGRLENFLTITKGIYQEVQHDLVVLRDHGMLVKQDSNFPYIFKPEDIEKVRQVQTGLSKLFARKSSTNIFTEGNYRYELVSFDDRLALSKDSGKEYPPSVSVLVYDKDSNAPIYTAHVMWQRPKLTQDQSLEPVWMEYHPKGGIPEGIDTKMIYGSFSRLSQKPEMSFFFVNGQQRDNMSFQRYFSRFNTLYLFQRHVNSTRPILDVVLDTMNQLQIPYSQETLVKDINFISKILARYLDWSELMYINTTLSVIKAYQIKKGLRSLEEATNVLRAMIKDEDLLGSIEDISLELNKGNKDPYKISSPKNLIYYLTGKGPLFLDKAFQLREALRKAYPDLSVLRREVAGKNSLEESEILGQKVTVDGKVDERYTARSVEKLFYYLGKESYFLERAVELREALRTAYPDLESLREALRDKRGLEAAEILRGKLIKDRVVDHRYTPVGVEQLLHYLFGRNVRFLNSALELREALRKKYPTLEDLIGSLIDDRGQEFSKREVHSLWLRSMQKGVSKGNFKTNADALWDELRKLFNARKKAASGSTPAMISNKPDETMLRKTPGGIDLDAKNMGLDIMKEGNGIKISFDPVLIAEFERGDFSGVIPIIINITPLSSPLTLLGLSP